MSASTDEKISELVLLLNRLGMGMTTDCCDGHSRGPARTFVGYQYEPNLPLRALPMYATRIAMKNPAYVDFKPHPKWRGYVANLMAYLEHQVANTLYSRESDSVRIEVRPGDKYQIHLTHEWDPSQGIFRAVHDFEMRVAFLKKLILEFDPRVPWDSEVCKEHDFFQNLKGLSKYSPARSVYPILRVAPTSKLPLE